MDHIQYPPLARRTAKPLPFYESARHAALGCGSDMGEVATLIKKMVVYGATLQTIDKDSGKTVKECLVEEMGDVCWFIVEACSAFGFSFSDVIFFQNSDSTYSGRLHLDKKIDYWALKGCNAAGRFCDLVAYNQSLDKMSYTVLAHLSNLFTAISQIAFRIHVSMDEVFEYNITKLRKRYPGQYTDQAALERADKHPGE